MTQPQTNALQALVMDSDEPTFAGTDGIFERKFLLPKEAIPHLLGCARQHLAPDKHANAHMAAPERMPGSSSLSVSIRTGTTAC